MDPIKIQNYKLPGTMAQFSECYFLYQNTPNLFLHSCRVTLQLAKMRLQPSAITTESCSDSVNTLTMLYSMGKTHTPVLDCKYILKGAKAEQLIL